MRSQLLFIKVFIFVASLFVSTMTMAQTLVGTWDLVESPDGRGPTAGTMTLSANGGVNFAGNRSTWQPNSSSVKFAVIGAMQVPATEISLQLNGSILQGKLVAYKYRMSGGQPVLESERSFPLSARRPDGYGAVEANKQQSSTAPTEQRGVQPDPRSSKETSVASSRTVPESRSENMAQNNTTSEKQQASMQDQLEAVAICWQNRRNQNKYSCDGPVQQLSMADYTLEEGLKLSGCPNPRLTEGSRTVKDRSVIVYLCGYGLTSSDRDVVNRNGLTVQRNTYSCPKSQWRCKGQ